jgi:hypothetical protein
LDVADGDDPNLRLLHEAAHVTGAFAAHTDAADYNPIARSHEAVGPQS